MRVWASLVVALALLTSLRLSLCTCTWQQKQQQKAAAAHSFAQMGIIQPPVPPEQLRAMMAACGVQPEDNLFRRGIEEMREE